jgi:hypothetical protein
MNVLTTIKDGDVILRASGRFANDGMTVSLNNFTGETWLNHHDIAEGGIKHQNQIKSEF